jgi:hypothetical protein
MNGDDQGTPRPDRAMRVADSASLSQRERVRVRVV